MDESKATSKAVVVSAILHVGIVAFLFLAILPCSKYEAFVTALGLPASMNPITCSKPLQLKGPIIEATLIGPTGSPPPKPVKAKPVKDVVPPAPAVPPPPVPPPPVKPPELSALPPPPKHVDVKNQERVVDDAAEKAEAKQLQEEKERQRQSELDAQAAKRKEALEKADALLAKMNVASAQTRKAESRAKQARQQMEDIAKAAPEGQPDLPKADQRRTGNNSPESGLSDEYKAAIQNAVTPNWLRPANIPDLPCTVNIVQSPGGDVMSATVDSSCPYDDAGRRSVENAVLRTKTLPYEGFQSVFQRKIPFIFRPQ